LDGLQQIPSHAGTKPHVTAARAELLRPNRLPTSTARQREDTKLCRSQAVPRVRSDQASAWPTRTGEQNPWISQTLRFTHIHNEKQPTKTLFEPRLEAGFLNLIDP